jgi:hypothetical protein
MRRVYFCGKGSGKCRGVDEDEKQFAYATRRPCDGTASTGFEVEIRLLQITITMPPHYAIPFHSLSLKMFSLSLSD